LSKRGVKGLRILGSIHLLQHSKEANSYARRQLEATIDPMLDARLSFRTPPVNRDPHALKLGTETVKLLHKHGIGCFSLINALLKVIMDVRM
jgi:hypothetical protein